MKKKNKIRVNKFQNKMFIHVEYIKTVETIKNYFKKNVKANKPITEKLNL